MSGVLLKMLKIIKMLMTSNLLIVDGQMAHWAQDFEQLFKVNPSSGQLQTNGLQVVDVDLPINEAAPSIDEVKEAMPKLRGGKAAGICNIKENCSKLEARP